MDRGMNMRKYLLPSALILAFGLSLALAQNITKSVQLSQSAGGPIGVDTSNNVYFPAHILSSGKIPTLSLGTIAAGSTDFQGLITETSNSIGGVLTFAQAFAAAPNCVLVAQTAASATPLTFTTVATALTYSHASQISQLLNYICTGAK
jgi:hypothetical protein